MYDLCSWTQALARQGLFGRGLPADQQTFVVITDSVAKQLDGLRKDPALSAAVRRFWRHGLDACGPAGAPLWRLSAACPTPFNGSSTGPAARASSDILPACWRTVGHRTSAPRMLMQGSRVFALSFQPIFKHGKKICTSLDCRTF